MGHALHFSHIDNSLPFEFKTLGDYAVTEGFAFLFQSLISDPRWLKLHLAADDGSLEEYIRLAKFLNLYLMRRYACKFIYEFKLSVNGVTSESASDYVDLFSKHLAVEYFPEDYMVDIDMSFYCLNYISAWELQKDLAQELKIRFQDDWMTMREAGKYLISLWKNGHQYNATELRSHTVNSHS